ncbi:hypothetical protein sphantq_02984 [Sphingobium sp. AntQ-1]|uniref:hypothetical protein n=1 Tax=Sphingobium sp. AntQ-1 TaxID=2930091 RepID=UPI00234E5780|nr:hypothetical protein [Sphingobium sp. AntQ-1]WCP14538.1 hypothetical protein sphantq_02984 [Sphingobium sp. AntQ-1]
MPIEPSERARKAAEALFYLACDGGDKGHIEESFARFEAETRKDERERCAEVAKNTNAPQPESLEQCAIVKCIYAHGEKIAAAIRNREGKP